MNSTRVENDDRDFAEAWRAFEQEDAALEAPPSAEAAVMAAWHARHGGGAGVHRRSRRVEILAAVAGILIAVAGAAVFDRARSGRDVPPSSRATLEALPATPRRLEAPAITRSPVIAAPVAVATPRALARAPEAVTAVVDSEPLQLVRVRMPREALRAFGVSLVEPEAASLVDVEMLVADDGLPRGIRNITAVLEGVGWE